MNKLAAWAVLLCILLGAFFLRQYRLLDFPYHGDEVDEGDIALEILHGNLAPFYPQNEGNEALYHFFLAPFFAILGDSVIANRWPSAALSTLFVALMYVYGLTLFRSRIVGILAAGLTAGLWWPAVFGRLGLREISQPVMQVPALLGLVVALRASSERKALWACTIGGIFAGLTSYTFLSGRGFPAIVITFLLFALLVDQARVRRHWRAFVIYLALMVGLSVPLFCYLHVHPELDHHVQDLASQTWLARGDLGGLIPQISDTLGMFTWRGDMNWVRNIAGRPVFVGPEGWLFYLGVALCLWRWRRPEYTLQLIVVAVMLVPNVLAESPPRWTRSIGILPGLLVLPSLPLYWAWSRSSHWVSTRPTRQRWWVSAASATLAGALLVSVFVKTAADMFQTWIDHPGVYWMTLAFYDGTARYVNQSTDSTPLNYVMDYYTPWRKTNVTRPIHRRDVAMRFSVNEALVFPNDPVGWRVAYQVQAAPARPLLEAFLDLAAPIHVDSRMDPTGPGPLRVYAVPRARLDDHLEKARAGVVVMPDGSPVPITPVRVADVLEFSGYEILNPGAAGGELDVLTLWHVLKRPPEMAIFVHLLDAEGNIVAQYDGFDVVRDELAAGDIVVQLHRLHLPAELKSGEYCLAMGAYVREGARRLPLNVGGDIVRLQTWQPPAR